MFNNGTRRIAGLIFAALAATSVALGQSAELQHADAKDHSPVFHSLEHFTITFRTDGTVPDGDVESANVQFNPISDGSAQPAGNTSFGVGCAVENTSYPLTVRDGKFVCSNLLIPGYVASGKYSLTTISLGQAKLNRGHNFNITPISIEVINTQQHQIELFDRNQPKDVSIEKQ